ncbi:probable E3 ubiquitin-protein ligase MID2 [Lineus longissimus]|uniref:probable E3 ubiquitin-protein ligase MID2 n=1 Tax=Lineus longissimus TaxID=88925 RepID=UPI00315C9E7C
MSAADSSLSSELECAICSDQLKQPKYIGPCNHTFCKECIDKYWVSLGWTRTIPCPECRQVCPIPRNGVDGLKDNFKLSNIIETYGKQKQKTAHPTETNCIKCQNGASSFCKECDFKLCPGCKGQHDSDPSTNAHELFGLCPIHGNGLLFFCSPCKEAVCSGCRISDHEQDDHHVIPIRPVVGALMSSIQARLAELENTTMTEVGEQETKLSQLRDIVQQKSTSAEVQETADSDLKIAVKKKEIGELRAKSQHIQKQIDILVKQKEEVDDRTKQCVKDIDKFEKEKSKTIADVRERFAKSSEEINLRLRSLETRRQEMKTKIEQGRAVGSTKITTDTESIAKLTSISQELVDLVRASRESDTVTVIEQVTRSLSKTKRDFRQLKKVCNFTFPRHRPCREVYRLKHLLVPYSGIAILGTSETDWADTIYFHDEESSPLMATITEGVHLANDMAVLSTGEVAVARQKKPPIRVFKPATGAYRDINITSDGEVIGRLWRVETDESDNMFVLTVSFNSLLLVVKPNGSVIQSVQLLGIAHYMAFCSLNRILYIAAGDRIVRFHWSNNILKEISPSLNGVARFRCSDVCIGSGGEVLAAGQMGHGDIGIYQVTEGADEEDMVWREIEYQDGVKRTCRSSPHICINDDNLWLGYDEKIDKFQLV